MNATDQISMLDNLYLLDVDTPSEEWTQAAQSFNSPDVDEYVDRAAEAAHSAAMLGYLLIVGWLAFFGGIAWAIWRVVHG